MSKNNKKENFAGLRELFPGGYIFTMVSATVDQNRSKKSDDILIKNSATVLTSKSIKVNQLKLKEVAGGVSVLEVNGGGVNGMEFGSHESLGFKEGGFGEVDLSGGKTIDGEKNRMFTADPAEVNKTANAWNASEAARLRKIKIDLEDQIKFIEGVIEANNNAAEAYSCEN